MGKLNVQKSEQMQQQLRLRALLMRKRLLMQAAIPLLSRLPQLPRTMLTGLMRCHLPRIYLASSYFITLFLYFLQQVLTFPQYTYVIIAEFAGLFYLCLRRCAILNKIPYNTENGC